MGRCRPINDHESDAIKARCDGPEELAFMGHRQISSTQQYLDSIVLDGDMDELILRAA